MHSGKPFDYVVIGAGPAGIQLAYYLKKAGLSFVVLDREAEVGAFFKKYPRHRKLLSINKVYTGETDDETNLRWDWNSLLSDEYTPLFKHVTKRYFPDADDLVEYLKMFVAKHEIEVELNTSVTKVERDENGFTVRAADGRAWQAPRLVVATGVSEEFAPPIPGIELCERYGTMPIDAGEFANQRVLIIGKGNSAFETADNLIETAASIHLASPRPLRMAWRTHFVGDLRAINNNILDTYQLKSQNAIIDGEINQVSSNGKCFSVEVRYAHANGEVELLEYDRVLVCTGFRFDTTPFAPSSTPAMTDCGRLPLQTSAWESPNVPGLYFAGVLMQQRDYKRYMSAFIHGFRYNVRALALHLLATHHQKPWPSFSLTYSPRGVAHGLLSEMNRASSIWQQPGFLTTLVLVDREARSAERLAEMPLDYAREHFLPGAETAFALTLEYGESHAPDPFNIERVNRSDVDRAAASLFLHPVIRRYQYGEQVDEHHVLEDLAAEWLEPVHVDPLVEYLQGVLTLTSTVSALSEAMDEDTASVA